MYEVAPILQRCKIFHVPGNFKFAIEGTNDEAALHTENAAITAASDSLGSVSLTGYEIVKLVKASRACSEMALSAFESYIVEVIAEAVARRIEKYIFTGTGTNQPGGVKTAGKGASGAYTDGTDQITVGKTASLTEENVITLYGLLGDGYERNAVWCMNKATFFSDFFPLMNKSKNNVIEFANGKYYIMGAEVYFTGSLAAHEAYLGDFSYIIGNYSQDITDVRSEHSGLATNSIDYLGACVFDCKPVAGLGAFVHLTKATAKRGGLNMAVSSEYLASVRHSVRLSSTVHDGELTDLINAARADLVLGGVLEAKANDETDPLIKKAVTTYVKAEFGLDNEDADRLRASYKEQRNGLSLSDSYIAAEEG